MREKETALASGKTLAELLAAIPFTSDDPAATEVSGIAYASDRVCEGDLFFCIVGFKTDGHGFAADAVARGAAALVCERHLDLDVPQFVVDDSRLALALASAAFFDVPTSHLDVVGVTGTNGKTTTAYLVEWIARAAGRRTGLIGTVETRIGDERIPSLHTTPESFDLQHLFADMVAADVETAVMEVSSQGIDLDRVKGSAFSVAAFSNLTQDHLDYHNSIEEYFACKRSLFTDYPVTSCAVCIDDGYGRRIVEATSEAGHPVLTCGLAEDADVRAEDIVHSPGRTGFTLLHRGMSYAVTMPLVGRFNVSNALLAIAICLQLGIPVQVIIDALAEAPQVPGRLEQVRGDGTHGFTVLVDYAHTPDALDKALDVVREITSGRVIVVFGCGGDRDRGKRPRMGKAATAADLAIVTSDNPRSEDPDAIIADILPGMADARARTQVIPDRRSAIRQALTCARDGDCVLIAGKGHEDYQILGDTVIDFDDRIVASEELDSL